jgi:hypothetical protein
VDPRKIVLKMADFRTVTFDIIPEAAQYVTSPLFMIPVWLRDGLTQL